ncbi:MAG TPA: exodeoxyribonuclease III [Gammaproteobacteria bacterium]|nr:exodeoxyribonuclease III [Gammaproteobacteria bacterium]
MKIATWNVNSLRVRLPHLVEWVATACPDILALQETKLTDDFFPVQELAALGYQAVYAGQKSYNGVALLSRFEARDVVRDIPDLDDPQRRVLSATYAVPQGILTDAGTVPITDSVGVVQDVRVLNIYVPNGSSVGSEKYSYKLSWLDKLCAYIEAQLRLYPRLVVLGDFNIAPEDRDVHDPKIWEGQVMVSEAERHFFNRLLSLGLWDTFRLFEQQPELFSWWDYRAAAFRRNLGLRIDHILVSPALRQHCVTCSIDKTPRKLERPSDHAPVIAEFNI